MIREVGGANLTPSELTERLAHKLQCGPWPLVCRLAEVHGFCVIRELAVPTESLLRATMEQLEYLRSLRAVPQGVNAAGGLRIAAADPWLLRQKGYREPHELLLALPQEVEETWRLVDRRGAASDDEPDERMLQEVLSRMVVEADALGGTEVFLGHPAADRYEFMVAGQRYAGRIHGRLFDALLSRLNASRQISFMTRGENPRPFSVALTRSFEGPVLCVSWEPLGERAKERASCANGLDPSPKAKPRRPTVRGSILVVDDDERFGSILKRILESKGWEVHVASGGAGALVVLSKQEIKLIITDLHMPRMDGAALVEEVRARNPLVPILVLTSEEDPLVEAELALRGVEGFIRKDQDPRILLAWCQNLLVRRRREEPVAASVNESEAREAL